MTKCEYCNKEMEGADSCIPRIFKIGKKVYEQIKYGDEQWYEDEGSETCGDCGVRKGGYHHPACDLEECPKCHEQFIGCDCKKK